MSKTFKVLGIFSILSAIALFAVTQPAHATSDVSQKSVISSSPGVLYFENMAPAISVTKTITLDNLTDKTLSVQAFLDFENVSGINVSSDANYCETETKCVNISEKDNRVKISPKGKIKIDMTVSIDDKITDFPEEIKLNGAVKIRGEVLPNIPTDETTHIIPDDTNNPAKKITELESTGIDEKISIIAALGGCFLLLGAILLKVSRRNKRP